MPDSDGIKHNLSNIYFQHAYDLYQNQDNQIYASNQHGEAKQLATQALSLYPRNINAYLLLGDIEYMNQNMTSAERAWQQASQLAPDNQQIKERLAKISREAHTENRMVERYNSFFIIKIDPTLAAIPNFDINQLLNTARFNVDQDFSFRPTHKIPVIVYTLDEYRNTLNGAPVWSEGAFDGKIRIILSPSAKNFDRINSTIVHEYTHAVISEISNNNCPRWLNEGIAKYEEYKHGIKPLINILAAASINNGLIAWDQINLALVSTSKNEALLAYQQSFNFVYYLVEKYGQAKLALLLRTIGSKPDFPAAVIQVYGLPLEALQKNWRGWLTDFIVQWAEQPSNVGNGQEQVENDGLFYSN